MRLFEFVPECETDCSVTAWLQTGKDIGLSKKSQTVFSTFLYKNFIADR